MDGSLRPPDPHPAGQARYRKKQSHLKKRASTIETIFGVIKSVLGFRGFSLRGVRGRSDPYTDTATRATLRETPAFSSGTSYGGPIWENPGPLLGHDALASVHAPADTLILAQKSAMAFLDFNRLTVERLTTRAEALEGFRTLLVTGWFDVAILDANGIISAVDPA